MGGWIFAGEIASQAKRNGVWSVISKRCRQGCYNAHRMANAAVVAAREMRQKVRADFIRHSFVHGKPYFVCGEPRNDV